MMLLSVVGIVEAVTTTPGDLVDRFFTSRGFAAVAVSAARSPIVLDRVRRDEVRLANLARSKWGLAVEPRTASARAVLLTYGDFFRHFRSNPESPRSRVTKLALSARGGALVRVQDLLPELDKPATVNSYVGRRHLWVRVGDRGLEAALPTIARAAGGRWDASARRIEFDPAAYREALAASVESFAPDDSRIPDRRNLIRLGLSLASDVDLERAYGPEIGGKVELDLTMNDAVRRTLGLYADQIQKLYAVAGSDLGDQVRRAIAEEWPAKIVIDSGAGIQILMRKQNSPEAVQF